MCCDHCRWQSLKPFTLLGLPMASLNLFLPFSPGRCPDWIRRQTWCTWKWGPPMDVSAVLVPLCQRPVWGLSNLICMLMTQEDEKPQAPLLPYPFPFPRVEELTSGPMGDFYWNEPLGMNFWGGGCDVMWCIVLLLLEFPYYLRRLASIAH